ncbi:MAG: ABC transporter substrate-binding protein [Gemmatimonadota bacterium]|jgi:peptide/nickel transport system substrate-binding protein
MKSTSTSLGICVALLAAACGGGEPDDARGGVAGAAGVEGDFCDVVTQRVDSFTTAAAEGWSPPSERYGGTVVVSGSEELPGMNALVSSDYTAAQFQQFVNLMTLVRYDEELRPVPWLAERFELADDSMSITFHLRDDVYWHDGVRTTADDVAFTFDRMTDTAVAFPNRSFWDPYVKGPDGVEVTDAFTVTFRFERRHAQPLDAWRAAPIMPKHLLEDVPAAQLAQHPYDERCPVGNGPFVFEEHRPGESWTFRANPAFPEALGGRPYLDRLVYRVIGEPTTALAELASGRTHVWHQAPAELAGEIAAAEGVELRAHRHREYVFVAWNSRRETLADRRVRMALALATDREALVGAILGGHGRVAQTTVYPSHWLYDPSVEAAVPYAPDRARALLAEAGWRDRDGDGVRENPDGLPLSLEVKFNAGSSQRRRVAELLQAQLARVGVEVEPRPMEYNTLVAQVTRSREFDGFVIGFMNEFKMDDRVLFHSESFDEPYGFSGTRNPALDTLMDTLPFVMDPEAARGLWARYQRELIEEQPFLFLWFKDQLTGVSEDLEGAVMDIRGEFVTVGDWWLRSE